MSKPVANKFTGRENKKPRCTPEAKERLQKGAAAKTYASKINLIRFLLPSLDGLDLVDFELCFASGEGS